jgi:uncharacterized protein
MVVIASINQPHSIIFYVFAPFAALRKTIYNLMKQIIILIILTFSIQLGFAQSPSIGGFGEADSATMYLTGTFKNYNPQKAFQINLQNANNGNPKAMNAVAMQYTKGLGVDSSFTLAQYWFNQAATNGYTKAWVNLGMLHKHNATDSVGYAVACSYFNQGLQVHEPSALFAMGYMYYKGLGCTQSYTNALQLFNQGINLNQANCFYFKGLCFKYGYGVAQNTDSTKFYIDSAAKMGYKQANAELYNNAQSSSTARTSLKGNKQSITTDLANNAAYSFLPIQKNNTPINISGEYMGLLNQYDYSGKKMIAQLPITLYISNLNNLIKGQLTVNNTQNIPVQAILQGNQLIFSNTAVATVAPLRSLRETKLIFKSANLNVETKNDSNFLTGTLQLFNNYTRETEKPINLKLYQFKTNTPTPKDQCHITKNVNIYPNPTKGNFIISFNLSKPSPVKIIVFNQQGVVVYTKVFEQLPQGKQDIAINFFHTPTLANGIYTATIKTNSFTQSTAFVYEK